MIHITRRCSARKVAATAEGTNCDVTAAAGMMSSVTQKCGIEAIHIPVSVLTQRSWVRTPPRVELRGLI